MTPQTASANMPEGNEQRPSPSGQFHTRGCRGVFGGWWLPILISMVPVLRLEAQGPHELRDPIDQLYRAELEALLGRVTPGSPLGQHITGRLERLKRQGAGIWLFVPPDQVDLRNDSNDELAEEFLALRRRQAQRLVELARQVVENAPGWSYRLLHEALWEWPDDEKTRAALGYRRHSERWVYGGQTITSSLATTSEQLYGLEARKYYRIVSPHFTVLSDREPQAGQRMAEQLERFHTIWRQLFFEYWGNGSLLAQRLERGAPPAVARRDKHRIVWFADRQRYVNLLRDEIPQIEKTIGIYLDKRRAVVVYGPLDQLQKTLWHEVTHQLLAESTRTAADPGSRGDVWAIEGIALFMESLRWNDSVAIVGGWDAPRLQYARFRALRGQFYVPAAQFVRLTRDVIQQDPNIASLYSQAAGWTHFLMTAESGKYRSAFIDYLRRLYQQQAGPDTLWQLTGLSSDEFDRRYVAFLKTTAGQLDVPSGVQELVLAFGAIGDHELAQLPLESLVWLDLSHTAVTDQGVSHLKKAVGLRRLSLEGTRVTSTALATLAQLPQLEELDLTGLPIGDEATEMLSRMGALRQLILVDTRITDAGLIALARLPKLEYVDLSGTDTTAAGRKKLKDLRPMLVIDSR